MSCVNCQCDQQYCYSFYEDSLLQALCCACHLPVVLLPNSDLRKGTPLAHAGNGYYKPFDPAATPPERFAGVLMRDVRTDVNSTQMIGGLLPMPGVRETQMYVKGMFRIDQMDITPSQLAAIEAQGAGRRVGDFLILG